MPNFHYRFKLRTQVATDFRTSGRLLDLFPEFKHRGALSYARHIALGDIEDEAGQMIGGIAEKWDGNGFGLSCHFTARPEYEVRGRARSLEAATRVLVQPVLERIEAYFAPADLEHGEVRLDLEGEWRAPEVLAPDKHLLGSCVRKVEQFDSQVEGPESSSGVQRLVRVQRELSKSDPSASKIMGRVSISYIVTSSGHTPISNATVFMLALPQAFHTGFVRSVDCLRMEST